MGKNKEMKNRETQQVQARSGQEIFLRPAVDIYEDDSGITLKADLPGVSRDRLDIQVEGNNLTIEGEALIDMPNGMESLYADINQPRFRRLFTLSNELETDKINAEMKNGELTLHLPKRAELKPRKIEVSAS